MSHVDLSHNTGLRSLTLRFYWCIRAPWISSKEERAMISTVLSRIHSPDFRDITLHITFPASGYNDPRWLSRLDMRVLDHLFPSGSTAKSSSLSREDAKRVESVAKKLKTVTLALTFSRTMDVREFGIIQKVITAQLPTLSSKRVLRIIHVFRE